MNTDPDNFEMTGVSGRFVIQYAYGLHASQVLGGPGWLDTQHFDIIAKVDPSPEKLAGHSDAEFEQKLLQRRLQALLNDRLQLRVHPGTRIVPVYRLEVVKGGEKLQPARLNTGFTTGPGQLNCSYTSMLELANLLSNSVDRIVVDGTNVAGDYSFTLKWSVHASQGTGSDLPGIFTALQEQLGLKLEPQKAAVPIVVIDRVQEPSAN